MDRIMQNFLRLFPKSAPSAIVGAALVLLTACSSTPTAPAQDTFAFYREGTKPDRPFRELQELFCKGWADNKGGATKNLIAQARKLHADGIIMLPRVRGNYQFTPFGHSGVTYNYEAAPFIWITNSPTPP